MFNKVFISSVVVIFFLAVAAAQPKDDTAKVIMTASEIKALLADTSRLSGLPIDPNKALPVVVSLPQKDFDKTMCGVKAEKCTVLAAFVDAYNLIVIGQDRTADLATLKGKAVLVHELTHYLSGMPPELYRTVEGCAVEETRAYDTERKYLLENKADASWVMEKTEVFLICAARFAAY